MAQAGAVSTALRSRGLNRATIVLATLALGLSAIVGLSCTPQQAMEFELATGINLLRMEQQLPSLPLDPILSSVARSRAEDMASKDYFSHNPPDGCDYRCLMQRQGTAVAWTGEIIAWNDYALSEAARISIEGWRNSPPHFAIISDCHTSRMGIGAAIAENGTAYHVAVFEGGLSCTPSGQ